MSPHVRRVVIWQRKGGDGVHEHKPFFDEGLVQTLERGFGAAEAVSVERGLWHSSDQNAHPNLSAGDIFIYVGIIGGTRIGWKRLPAGVRRIFYQRYIVVHAV